VQSATLTQQKKIAEPVDETKKALHNLFLCCRQQRSDADGKAGAGPNGNERTSSLTTKQPISVGAW